MIMPEHPLRCWEEPHTGERHGFADLAQLVIFWQGFVAGAQDGADIDGAKP